MDRRQPVSTLARGVTAAVAAGLSLSAGTAAELPAPASAAGPVTISVNDVTVTEGDNGEGSALATFAVTLSQAASSTVTVRVNTGGGTASTSIRRRDYSPIGYTLTFPPGRIRKLVTVPIIGDPLDERDETFNLNLSAPTNATVADGTGLGTILDDDTAHLSVTDAAIPEPTSKQMLVEVGIVLSTSIDQPVTVTFATADGTASAPDDYFANSGTRTLNYPPGDTYRRILIRIKPDQIPEGDETFYVNVAVTSGNPVVDDLQGVVTITGG